MLEGRREMRSVRAEVKREPSDSVWMMIYSGATPYVRLRVNLWLSDVTYDRVGDRIRDISVRLLRERVG